MSTKETTMKDKTVTQEQLDLANNVETATEVARAEVEVPMQESKYISTGYFNPVLWSQMKGMAATFIQSGALPKHITTISQAIVQMQVGIEMGMKPMESIQSLYMVNGAVNIWGKATVKALRKHGWQIGYVSEDEMHCTAKVTNKDGESYTDTFKYQDAEDSGYTKDSYGKPKIGWRKGANRSQKMRYNVLSKIIKSYIPEVLEGAAEIQEVYEDVEMINIDDQKPVTKGGKVKNVEISTPKEQDKKIKDFISA